METLGLRSHGDCPTAARCLTAITMLSNLKFSGLAESKLPLLSIVPVKQDRPQAASCPLSLQFMLGLGLSAAVQL